MTSHAKLIEKFSAIATLEDLKSLMTDCLDLVAKEKDPVASFMLAQALGNFRSIVSLNFLEGIGVIPDADFYFSFAFHRFMQLANSQKGDAARWVAQYYLLGYCPVEKNETEYLRWLKLAAQYGDKLATAEFGELAQ